MTPYQKAHQVYDSEPCARTFEADLIAHLQNGYVISTPTMFAMFRPVAEGWTEEQVLNALFSDYSPFEFPLNCWHVYCMAGDLLELPRLLPYSLPFISFERKNKLRFYDYPKLLEKIERFSLWTNSTDPISQAT